MINIQNIQHIEKVLRNELSNNKELWSSKDESYLRLVSLINQTMLLIKVLKEKEKDGRINKTN